MTTLAQMRAVTVEAVRSRFFDNLNLNWHRLIDVETFTAWAEKQAATDTPAGGTNFVGHRTAKRLYDELLGDLLRATERGMPEASICLARLRQLDLLQRLKAAEGQVTELEQKVKQQGAALRALVLGDQQ